MWFGKAKRQFLSNYSKVKSVAQHAYHSGRKIASYIDEGLAIAGRVHQAIRPLLDETEAGRQASRAIKSGMTQYSQAKESITQKHRRIEETAGLVRTAAPELF